MWEREREIGMREIRVEGSRRASYLDFEIAVRKKLPPATFHVCASWQPVCVASTEAGDCMGVHARRQMQAMARQLREFRLPSRARGQARVCLC